MERSVLPVQVPSFRADPLTPACDTWCEFPVSDRPNAVMQFFKAAAKDPSMIKVCLLPHHFSKPQVPARTRESLHIQAVIETGSLAEIGIATLALMP